jgi:hypothetical protein
MRMQWWKIGLIIALLAVLTGLRLYRLESEGVTYDEPVYVKAGREYFRALGALQFRQELWSFNKEHPPVTKYVYGFGDWVGRDVFNIGVEDKNTYTASRITSVLLGTASLAYVMGIALFYLPFWWATLGMVLVGVFPHFVAHTRLAGHESVMLFFMVGTWYWYLAYREKKTWWRFGLMNLHAILGFASRFNIVLGFLPIWIWEAVDWVKALRLPHKPLRKIPWVLIWLPVSVWLGTFLLFPYWWTDPITSIQSTLLHWGGDPQELFLGTVRSTPWTYYWVYFWAQTPAPLLVLGFFQALWVLWTFRIRQGKELFLVGIFTVWFLWSLSNIKQGGMRYILPIYVPFLILAVIQTRELLETHYKKMIQGVIGIGLVVFVGLQTFSLGPWHLDYYNGIVGGISGVWGRNLFPLGFWGQGTTLAVSEIGRLTQPGESVGMYVFLMPEHRLEEYLPEGVTAVYKNNLAGMFESDWLLVQDIYREFGAPIPSHYELVNIIKGPKNVPMFSLYIKNNTTAIKPDIPN